MGATINYINLVPGVPFTVTTLPLSISPGIIIAVDSIPIMVTGLRLVMKANDILTNICVSVRKGLILVTTVRVSLPKSTVNFISLLDLETSSTDVTLPILISSFFSISNIRKNKLISELSRDSVLEHHLSMPQPDLIGKPTPSVCLSCCLSGNNDFSVFPTKSSTLGFAVTNFLQFLHQRCSLFLIKQIYHLSFLDENT